jgi:signal transduction histidine kinase
MIAEEDQLEAYIRISQYLANLSADANPFEEVRQILKSELGPRHVCFFTSTQIAESVECHEACCNRDSCILPQLFQSQSVDVLKDQFIDTTVIDAAPGMEAAKPLSVIFLSLPVKHHPPCVMSVAYEGEHSFGKTILNIYLGVAGIVATVLDRISDEKERMAHLADRQKVREELAVAEATLRTRGTFYASISHDIRSPIAAVFSLSELLLDEDLQPDHAEIVQSIHSSSESVLGLLSDVMDFSRMEVGKLKVQSVPFDPIKIITDLRSLLLEQAHRKSLDFECNTEQADSGPYLGDALRIRQILMNFLTNAIKFTPEGKVGLTLRTEPADGATSRLLFEVTDTGIGIAKEKLKEVFGSFEQAEGGTAAKYGGSGLGLAICKSLVDLMHGEIDVSSSPEGSSFRVSLSLPKASSSEAAAAE